MDEDLNVFGRNTGIGTSGGEFVQVLFADEPQQGVGLIFPDAKAADQGRKQAQMGNFKDRVRRNGKQAFCSQFNHFCDTEGIYIAQTLQTNLQNFPEGTGTLADPVDILIII